MIDPGEIPAVDEKQIPYHYSISSPPGYDQHAEMHCGRAITQDIDLDLLRQLGDAVTRGARWLPSAAGHTAAESQLVADTGLPPSAVASATSPTPSIPTMSRTPPASILAAETVDISGGIVGPVQASPGYPAGAGWRP